MKSFMSVLLFVVVLFLMPTVSASILKPSFERVVERSDLIAVVLIKNGRIQKEDSSNSSSAFPDYVFLYCAEIHSVVFGENPGDEVCFQSKDVLKVGGMYFTFSRILRYPPDEPLSTYWNTLSLEVTGRYPGDVREMVRWEPPKHPPLVGLTEQTFSVDYIDEVERENDRVIPVWSYFLLSEVEELVLQIRESDARETD